MDEPTLQQRVRKTWEAGQNYLCIFATDPSPLAALLVGYIPTGMRPPRALPSGRLDCETCKASSGQPP